jgi:hypothetical protein
LTRLGYVLALLPLIGCLPRLREGHLNRSEPDSGSRNAEPVREDSEAGPALNDGDAGASAQADAASDAGCPTSACPPFVMSFDAIYLAALADLITFGAEDQVYTRYLSLANRRGAGVCGAALENERRALTKLLNSSSRYFQLGQPVAIDSERTLYRIDLRDYGWNQATVVNGASFTDGWEALLSRVPSAVAFTGDQADDLARSTESKVPLLMADAFIEAASSTELYYALTGAPATLAQLLASLPVNVQADVAQRTAQRAGLTISAESGLERVVERHAFASSRVYWQASDVAAGGVRDNPLAFTASRTLALYSLPNRLPAYFVADGAGNRQTQWTLAGQTLADVASCMECHLEGVLPVADQVRDYVAANASGFSAEDLTRVNDLYVPASSLSAVLEADRAVFAGALAASGAATCSGACCAPPADPISAGVARYRADLTLEQVIGDLGTTRAAFDAAAYLLDPRLAALRDGGTIERASFLELYTKTLCVLAELPVNNQVPRNLPDLAVCDRANALPDAGN